MPHVAGALGFDFGSPSEVVLAKDWRRLEESPYETVLFHYDFTRRPFREKRAHRDGALRILSRAGRLSFLTLWAPPHEVDRRYRRKLRQVLVHYLSRFQIRRAWHAFHDMRSRLPFVSNRDAMWELYVTWFGFTSTFSLTPHWILRSDGAVENPCLLSGTQVSPFWEDTPGSST